MEKDYVDYNTLAAIMAPQTQALQAIAMRPQKTSAYTTTTSTPRALSDMIANRDRIGTATRELDDALKARETLGYTLANSLANVPQQQGYGSWLSDLARGFGSGATMRTNAQVDRAQKTYDAKMKDLAEILAYDKAMGETQVQNQVMGYTPMEYGATGGTQGASGDGLGDVAKIETTGENLGDLFQTINKNPYTFSAVGGAKPTEEARGLRAAVSSKGLTDLGHREFAYLNSIMPKGFSTAINTAAEQKLMRPYTTQFDVGTGSAKKASIKNMLGDIYDAYKNEALSQGLQMPISKQDYVNQRINAGRPYNAKYFIGQSDQMYETDDSGAPVQQVRESTAAEQFMRGTI
jgi:hypothetical protein